MNLALRDHKIYQLKSEVENRKRMLCAKRQQLKATASENVLLNDVLADYEKYNNHIISQRNKQIAYFETLNQYIDNITTDLQMTDTKLKESKYEQREILKEISLLKKDIDDLVKTFEPY